MKRIAKISIAVLTATMIAGCGGSSESTTTDGSSAKSAPSTSQTIAQPNINNQDPKSAITVFLDAMRAGDDKTAEYLLTSKAREETARQDMVVQPPGTPNAVYQIGRVEYPKDKEGTAYVECTWTEKYDSGQQDQYEVVWVLHQEKSGWHIAGMATELDNSGSVVFLDFENPSEMMEKVRQAEQMAAQTSATKPVVPPASPAPPAPPAAVANRPSSPGSVIR